MKYDELKNALKYYTIPQQVFSNKWLPFKKTFVILKNNEIMFCKRAKKPALYQWGCAYDKDREYHFYTTLQELQ